MAAAVSRDLQEAIDEDALQRPPQLYASQALEAGILRPVSIETGLVSVQPIFVGRIDQEPAIKPADDFHGWLLDQASALRERRSSSLDWDNLAEELEAMAATDRRELLRRLTTLFEHLLKLAYQPDELPQRGNGWRGTVVRSRIEVERLLNQSPGLKGQIDEYAVDAYLGGRRAAGATMGFRRNQWETILPEVSPWSIERALEAEFFPS